MKILAVDDSREHLEVVKDILESDSFTVITTENPLEAINLVDATKFDCIILDLKMPALGGKHLLTIIKEKHPEVPIIIFSGFVENENELIEKGAYAILRKPSDISTLVATVENAIYDAGNQVKFVFNYLNLTKIKDKVITRMITLALNKAGGNQMKAAELLGISRQGLIRYMKKFRIAS